MSDRPINLEIGENKDIKYIDLSSMKIANCVGCFGCWTKTTKVYPFIAESSSVIYVSHIKYGGYDSVMKTMLERAIPIQQAFIRIHQGETHHVQRNVATKESIIIAYGDTDREEQEIFRQLVERNARNMNFGKYEIVFVTEQDVEKAVQNELKKWEK